MFRSLPEQIVLSTGNPGKALELRALLSSLPARVTDLTAFPGAPEVVEDGTTLSENALIKARAIHKYCRLPALADDTGLEVTALGDLPGVHSARFAGPNCNARDNRAKLLDGLKGCRNRKARFVTVLALVGDAGEYLFEGQCQGHIAPEELTRGGFGYESLFVPDGFTQCFAQLTTEEKNAVSHRGAAARKLIRFFAG